MISIYDSCIDYIWTLILRLMMWFSYIFSASNLLHKDVANFDAPKCCHPHVDSLCMANVFSSHFGLSRVFDSKSLSHINILLLSSLFLHINTLHVDDLHFHLINCNVHGIMNSCCLIA